MPDLLKWFRRRRGAAMTEKLLVILFASVLVGGAIMIFGPQLSAKYEAASRALGNAPKTSTLADPGRYQRESDTNPIWYVVFAVGGSVFFIGFVTPMLFPRARQKRNSIIVDLAERWPMLTPLIDENARSEAHMEELRAMAEEARRLEKHRENALEIIPSDFGRQADPADATVDSDGVEYNLHPVDHFTGRNSAVPDFDDLDLGGDPEATMAARPKPLSERMKALSGDDDIPFDAISPDVKPQMQPLAAKEKPRTDRMYQQNPRTDRMFAADDSTTVDSGRKQDEKRVSVGEILRESAQLPVIGDSAETVVRESGPLPVVADEADATVSLDGLAAADQTTPNEIRGAADPDATTNQDWDPR